MTPALDAIAAHVLHAWRAVISPASDLHWLFLLSAITAAFIIYVARRIGPPRAFPGWMFPRALYTDPSVRIDLAVFALNAAFLAIPSAAIAVATGGWVRDLLAAVAGTPALRLEMGVGTSLMFTAVLVLCGDLALYFSHRAMHKSALLWEFHKAHHSAPVLMPLTAYRQHPVEELLTGVVNGLAVGLPSGLFLYLAGGVSIVEIGGHNAVEFAALIAARHLRHSHVDISFGPLEKLLVSPAMHQLHHSAADAHIDKNFGQIFSLWDHLWRSYHRPALPGTVLRFGINGGAENRFATLPGFYLAPFAAAFRLCRERLGIFLRRTIPRPST